MQMALITAVKTTAAVNPTAKTTGAVKTTVAANPTAVLQTTAYTAAAVLMIVYPFQKVIGECS